MCDKSAQYLRKMGGMILIASIVVWFLSYFPRERTDDAAVTNYENSYLGRIGQACEPVFPPLGLHWKAGVALLSGISAKEIVVSTLGVLYAEETPAAAGGGPEGTADATRRIASGKASQTAVQKTIIGGADGPIAIVCEGSSKEKLHAVCSSLLFELVEGDIEWRIVFNIKSSNEMSLGLI